VSARHQIKRSDQDVRRATVQSKDGPAGETVFLHSVRIIDPRFHRRVSARVKFDHDVFADPLVFCGACRWQGRASSQIISPEHLLIQPARRAAFSCAPAMHAGDAHRGRCDPTSARGRTVFRAACGDGYRDAKTQGKPFLTQSAKCLCRKAFSQISDFETIARSGSIHRDT
jgi:hypothetical protein